MHTEYYKWWSPNLGQDMELKIYGHAGKPILVFPAQGGRFYEYEDFGMVEACRGSIEAGSGPALHRGQRRLSVLGQLGRASRRPRPPPRGL